MADSKPLRDTGLTGSYKCAYCLKRFYYMVDPRKLPCSHIFCTPCMKIDLARRQAVWCIICRTRHGVTDVTSLPRAYLSDPVQKEADNEIVYCDICMEAPTKATAFGVDEEKKFCDHHKKVHGDHMKSFFNKEVKFIPIVVYNSAPHHYKSVKCRDHTDHLLKEACSVCHKTFCMRCDTRLRCADAEENGDANHLVKSLQSLSDDLRERLADLLKTLSEKIARVDKLEKETWGELSDIEDEADTMKKRVDQEAEEKITAIRKQAENLKTEIQVYVNQSVNKVEVFVSELMARRDVMESLWNSTKQRVKVSPDSEIVAKYRDEKIKLDDVEDAVMIDSCSIIHRALVHTDEEKYLNEKLLKIPKYVEFNAAAEVFDYNARFWTVELDKDGRVLCGARSALQAKDPDTLEVLKSVSVNTEVEVALHLIQPADAMLAQCYKRSKELVDMEISLLDPSSLKKIRSMHKFTHKAGYMVGRISQQGTGVYLVDTPGKLLIVCSLIENNNKVLKIPIPDMTHPVSIYILPDTTILIGDYAKDGKVTRYTLDKTAELLTEVWQTDAIAWPTGISYDSAAELIYVSSAHGHIRVITLTGSLLQTLSCDDLDERQVNDIAVSGDKLFIACNERGLRRYTLKY